jgi:tripartite-type tricarboxylate transporter receptor subunit TctC
MTPALAACARLALAAALFTLTAVHAQDFPSRPVRVISQFNAGSALDAVLRLVGEKFKDVTGQQLLIDNKPGGSGFVAALAGANALPDGYSILMGGSGMMTVNPHTFKTLPYDPEKSFRPVTNLIGAALVFGASSAVPANDLHEFVAWAKAHPNSTNFASYTPGSPSHFAGYIFNKRAGIDMLHVPYNGAAPAVTALLGGQVQTAFLQLLSLKAQLDSGRVKAFAITGEKRSPLLPNVPTFAELGYPEMTIYAWIGLYVPAATPDPIVGELSSIFNKVLRSPEIAEKLRSLDFEPLPSTPAELAAYMKTDSARWQEAVKLSGFKPNE